MIFSTFRAYLKLLDRGLWCGDRRSELAPESSLPLPGLPVAKAAATLECDDEECTSDCEWVKGWLMEAATAADDDDGGSGGCEPLKLCTSPL